MIEAVTLYFTVMFDNFPVMSNRTGYLRIQKKSDNYSSQKSVFINVENFWISYMCNNIICY
jgi:hypothetical protein